MNYTADIRGDLISEGFEPMSGAPHSHDEHDLALLLDGVREIAPMPAPVLNPEQIVPSEDGWMDPAMEAAHSPVLEPNTDPTSCESGVIGPQTLPRLQDANRVRPCLSNQIGHPSWSSPPRIFFTTHPWVMC